MSPIDPERLEWLRSNSGIRLDAEGRFWYRDALVEHPKVQSLFHAGLGRAPDGRATLTVGRTWCYVQVDDALYQARRALCEAPGGRLVRVRLLLDDGGWESVGPDALRLSDDGVLYARVKDGREWARLWPEAHAAVGQFVDERDGRLHLGEAPLDRLDPPQGRAAGA